MTLEELAEKHGVQWAPSQPQKMTLEELSAKHNVSWEPATPTLPTNQANSLVQTPDGQYGLPNQTPTATPSVTMSGAPTPTSTITGDPAESESTFFSDTIGFVKDLPDDIAELIYAPKRKTQEIEGMPDWDMLPEMQDVLGKSFMATFSSLMAPPDEKIDILKTQFPGIKTRKDSADNWIITSAIDGKDYAIQPGLRTADIPDILAGVAGGAAAGLLAPYLGALMGGGTMATIGAAAGTEAVIQAGHEAMQTAGGGEFNVAPIAMAGALGGGMRAGGALVDAVRGRGVPLPTDNIGVAQAAPAPAPVQAPVAPLQPEQFAQVAQKAATGKPKAVQALAQEVRPDLDVLAAAKDLDIEDFLQPDHVSTNQVFRELQQLAKSKPGSPIRAKEAEGLQEIGLKAKELVEEFGGTDDLSLINSKVKNRLDDLRDETMAKESELYAKVRGAVPKGKEVDASETLGFLKDKAEGFRDGIEGLSKVEKEVFQKLSPDSKGKLPTYDDIDELRKSLGADSRSMGVDGERVAGLSRKLYGLLTKDQEFVAKELGIDELWTNAKSATKVRAGLEDDMKALFGKKFDDSLVSKLLTSTEALSKGDEKKFINLIKSVPKDMREEFTISALTKAFGKATKNGELNFNTFSRFWDGIEKSSASKAALMTNLPKGAYKKLDNLAKVSKAVNIAVSDRVRSGLGLTTYFEGPDSLIGKLVSVAKDVGVKGAVSSAATSLVGMPGAGLAFAFGKAIQKGSDDVVEKLAGVLASPEFKKAMVESIAEGIGQEKAVRRMALSKPFKAYARAVNIPKGPGSYERWITSAIRTKEATEDQE